MQRLRCDRHQKQAQISLKVCESIGLNQSKAKEAAKSAKSASILKELIEKKSLSGKVSDEKQATLLAALANALAKTTKVGDDGKVFLVDEILNANLKSVDQVTGES